MASNMPDKKLTDSELKKMIAICCENCINENKTAYEVPCKFCISHSKFEPKDFVHKIKAEAYKEFAERVKVEFPKMLNRSESAFSYLVDNLVKEMVGETDGI